ncbi:MAG: hypothetical protein IT305_26635 [Chloroflexi bacterium]|nr:hypothetical protein [Chloroflexota bacterium]
MTTADDLRKALIQADRRLSKFNPLPRILAFDDFDEGVNGWCELCGNHDGNLDHVRAVMADLRPPQISSCTFFDIGTHGSVDGTYSLKLATRARKNHQSVAIKRLTMAGLGLVQVETYFTFKSEATFDVPDAAGRAWDGNYHPSESHFGDFSISNDICDAVEQRRYHCALRYINTDPEGNFVQKWFYKTELQPTTRMYLEGEGRAAIDWHTTDPNAWQEVPGGDQPLCYNEVPTKVNWHYLRWVFDTRARTNVELQVNDRVMNLREIPVPIYPNRYEGLSGLLNLCFDVRTHSGVRNFLFLDSVVLSVDW